MILIGQQSDDKQPIKLTHGISMELGGGRVIEEKYNLNHGNNLRLWNGGPLTEVVKLQRGLGSGFDYILTILFII